MNATVPAVWSFSRAIQTIHSSASARFPQRSFQPRRSSRVMGSQYGALYSASIMAYATLPRCSSSPFRARRMVIPSGSSIFGISSVLRSSNASTRSWPNPMANNPSMIFVSAAEMYRLWLKMPFLTQSSPSKAYRSCRVAVLSSSANAYPCKWTYPLRAQDWSAKLPIKYAVIFPSRKAAYPLLNFSCHKVSMAFAAICGSSNRAGNKGRFLRSHACRFAKSVPASGIISSVNGKYLVFIFYLLPHPTFGHPPQIRRTTVGFGEGKGGVNLQPGLQALLLAPQFRLPRLIHIVFPIRGGTAVCTDDSNVRQVGAARHGR